MAVDVEKMRKFAESQQRGGDFIQFDVGDTDFYIHPGVRGDEDEFEPTTGMVFVPCVVHYGVGGKLKPGGGVDGGNMVVSLDPESNPIITHPFIRAILKKKKVKLTGECPMKEALDNGTIDGDMADENRPNTRFLFGMTPVRFRPKPTAAWSELDAKPGLAFVGKQIMDGILQVIFDNGDISDPKAAYLVRITREGTNRNTKYSVKAEPEFLKKPFVMPKVMLAKVNKAIAEDGDCDTFKVVGNMIKGPAEVQAIISGIKVSSEPDDEGEEEDDEADLPKPKKKAKAPPVEEEEEEAPAPKKKAKAPPPEEEEEEEEAPPPPKKKAKAPPPEEEEEEEEEAPPPKKKAKPAPVEEEEEEEAPKPAKKKVKPAPADDDDELELADLEEALENIEEEEEEAPKPAKKKAKAPPPDEDDDEEEEAPKPVKKKAK